MELMSSAHYFGSGGKEYAVKRPRLRRKRAMCDKPDLVPYQMDTITHLDNLLQLLKTSNSDTVEAMEKIATLRAEVSDLLKPIDAEYAASASALAWKVFDIPEVLEHIFSYLDNRSLLRVQQVCRSFSNCIENSLALQRKIGWQPDVNSTLRFPMMEFTVLVMFRVHQHVKTELESSSDHTSIRFSFEHYGLSEPKPNPFDDMGQIGKKIRSILICQPPVSTIQAQLNCCKDDYRSLSNALENSPVEITASDQAGVTYGDVIDAYLALKEQHKLCPNANPWQHDDDGFVDAGITFTATVTILQNDPVLKHQRVMGIANEARVAAERLTDQYMTAKRDGECVAQMTFVDLLSSCIARDRGLPIPTLAEFKATTEPGEG